MATRDGNDGRKEKGEKGKPRAHWSDAQIKFLVSMMEEYHLSKIDLENRQIPSTNREKHTFENSAPSGRDKHVRSTGKGPEKNRPKKNKDGVLKSLVALRKEELESYKELKSKQIESYKQVKLAQMGKGDPTNDPYSDQRQPPLPPPPHAAAKTPPASAHPAHGPPPPPVLVGRRWRGVGGSVRNRTGSFDRRWKVSAVRSHGFFLEIKSCGAGLSDHLPPTADYNISEIQKNLRKEEGRRVRMTGDTRKQRSKWDMEEIVEISEDESLPDKTGVHHKGGDLHPKPDTSMHHGGAGHEKEQTDGFNKDIREIQPKASSDRSQPLRTADERDNSEWGKAAGNQGMNRYADDRRRGDGWGTALSRGYSSRMTSDPDAWGQHSRSPSPRGVWNRSRRNRSRSRSRSRNRSRSRSRSRGRGRGRSRSPHFADRGSEWRVERGRTSGGPALPCRDFVAGRCRRGSNCRFLHEDGGHRPFEEHYPAGPRERYGYQSKELMDSREQNDYLRSRQSRDRYDDGTWERSEPRRDYRSAEQCYNFAKGRCSRGASCRFAHDDSASHGGWRDEARESAHDRVGPDSSYGNRNDHRRVNKNPCKFFAEGRCRRGENCPYLHEEASQSQIGVSAPDDSLNYSDGRMRGNYSSWVEQNNVMHATSQILSRDDRENPISQSIGRNDSRYEYENRHSKDAGKSQYQIIPQEDFASQVQNKHEVAVSQEPQLLTPVKTSVDNMNDEKVSGINGQSAPATDGDLSMQSGMHSANIVADQNLGQILQSNDVIPQIPGPSTLPVTAQLQNVTSSFPSNSHMQQNNFSVHQNRQEQFVVPQAAANNSSLSMRGQPVAPHMGHSQHGYGLQPQALPNLSAHNGQNFSVAGQVQQNLPTTVLAGQSQATIEMPRLSQDSGAQSIPNMQNFQPIAPNAQPLVPTSSSADMAGAVSHNAGKSEEEVRRVAASLAQYFGNAGFSAGTVGLQSSQLSMNSSMIVTSSSAPPAVQPNPWPWAQQQGGMVQPALSVPSEQQQQQAPQTFQMPMAVGSSNGNSMLLPHSGAPTGQAAASMVNETVPSAKKGETKDSDAEAHEDGENKKSKDSKALKMFKIALADFVKEALKPTWKEGQMSREVHKTIVKKVVDKVTSTVETTPPTKEKIDIYMSYSKEKLNKLVQAYVGKYAKT